MKRKIDTAKFLDEYAGRALMALFAVFRFFSSRRNEKPTVMHRILFIKFWGIGSIILSEPALAWLKRNHPAAEIHYLTFEHNRPLFPLLPVVDRVVSLPFINMPVFLWKSVNLCFELRKERYDLIIDGEFFARYSVLLAYASGGKRIVGFAQDKSLKRYLLHEAIPFARDTHAATQFLRLVRAETTGQIHPPMPRLDLDHVDIRTPADDLPQPPYIVVNVNASPLAWERRWPKEYYIHLARALLHEFTYNLVLIGEKSETAYVQSVQAALDAPDRVINTAGRLDLPQLALVIRKAALFISNDSGPIHLASALQIPVVGFYGPETPTRYGPLSSRQLIFYQDLWCSPCMSVDNAKTVNCINHQACMKMMTPDAVLPKLIAFVQTHLPLSKQHAPSDESIYPAAP